MIPNDIINDAKRIAQDNGLLRTPDIYSAATLLSFVNQVLRQTALLRPDLFTLMTDIATVPNVVEQSMPTDSIRLVNIFAVKNGSAILEVSRETMDQSYPQWRSDPAGLPVNYMRHVRNPNRYFLYPKPSAGVVLTGEYAQSPPVYTAGQTVALLPDAFQPAMVAGVVMLIAGIENSTTNAPRFQQFQETYSQTLGVNLQLRTVTDTKASGLDERQVI
jgi:hypothetical protein